MLIIAHSYSLIKSCRAEQNIKLLGDRIQSSWPQDLEKRFENINPIISQIIAQPFLRFQPILLANHLVNIIQKIIAQKSAMPELMDQNSGFHVLVQCIR